ncbi:hypothetical protein IV203_028400 [Nitzschia inconspicua]|uniref:Uncharacterized protein n=1 Tax=Nitzschia inconspicua TaxID=303405 RepID=A0A9K3LPJ1_9STRA|nr:hypothetical protein IV203_007679 [Nitzschia inconspicua]KAG7365730.1 hypothetical protein IV203_028400 [Nitzschia inconspicua]
MMAPLSVLESLALHYHGTALSSQELPSMMIPSSSPISPPVVFTTTTTTTTSANSPRNNNHEASPPRSNYRQQESNSYSSSSTGCRRSSWDSSSSLTRISEKQVRFADDDDDDDDSDELLEQHFEVLSRSDYTRQELCRSFYSSQELESIRNDATQTVRRLQNTSYTSSNNNSWYQQLHPISKRRSRQNSSSSRSSSHNNCNKTSSASLASTSLVYDDDDDDDDDTAIVPSLIQQELRGLEVYTALGYRRIQTTRMVAMHAVLKEQHYQRLVLLSLMQKPQTVFVSDEGLRCAYQCFTQYSQQLAHQVALLDRQVAIQAAQEISENDHDDDYNNNNNNNNNNSYNKSNQHEAWHSLLDWLRHPWNSHYHHQHATSSLLLQPQTLQKQNDVCWMPVVEVFSKLLTPILHQQPQTSKQQRQSHHHHHHHPAAVTWMQ